MRELGATLAPHSASACTLPRPFESCLPARSKCPWIFSYSTNPITPPHTARARTIAQLQTLHLRARLSRPARHHTAVHSLLPRPRLTTHVVVQVPRRSFNNVKTLNSTVGFQAQLSAPQSSPGWCRRSPRSMVADVRRRHINDSTCSCSLDLSSQSHKPRRPHVGCLALFRGRKTLASTSKVRFCRGHSPWPLVDVG